MPKLSTAELKQVLDDCLLKYGRPGFVIEDPISIPHSYKKKEDIEIMGLFASIWAWGQRPVIIQKCRDLDRLMEHSPYDFIASFKQRDLERFMGFRHRTFNYEDLCGVLLFLQEVYRRYPSLECAFTQDKPYHNPDVEQALINFQSLFFSLPNSANRTKKHLSSPESGSACKRLNMFLRWMVRPADEGIDFGIWQSIKPHQLICPLDLHVGKMAIELGLLETNTGTWKNAKLLTEGLKQLDPTDPVKYDLALFGLGLETRYGNKA